MRIRHLNATAVAVTALAVAAGGLLAACSSSAGDSTSASAVTSSASAPATAGPGGTPEMVALCTQMVDQKLSAEDATALAEKSGYVARVGTIDGQPQAVTMDLRDDRFTFDVEGGVVVGCTYG